MSTRRVLLAAMLLAGATGCGGSSEPTASTVTSDRDRDGFTQAAGDCDDQNAAVNPNGTVVAQSCVWRTTQWDCPRGSDKYPEDNDAIFVHVTNNQCAALSVVEASVHVTVLEAHGTFNQPNEKWTSQHVRLSPNSLPMAVTADVEIDGDVVCSNSGGGGSFNVIQAEVVLQTSAGPLTCVTSNTHTTRFPFADGSAGAEALAGTPHASAPGTGSAKR
jgi:hypothetical protein